MESWEIDCDVAGCAKHERAENKPEWLSRSYFRAMGWRLVDTQSGALYSFCPVHYSHGDNFSKGVASNG